jgi:phosphoheptose isomerase
MTYFPEKIYEDAGEYSQAYFKLLSAAADTVDPAAMAAAGRLLADVAKAGGSIYSCGNGGSAAIANHLVCDCLKGIRTNSTLRPRVYSLSTTVETLTAIVNDIGSDEMFSFQLNSLGRAGDVLIAISSSGSSPNIIAALNEAKRLGMATIAMTGFGGGDSAKIADVSIHVDSQNYGLVEDTHQSIMHILAQYLRHAHLEDSSKVAELKF